MLYLIVVFALLDNKLSSTAGDIRNQHSKHCFVNSGNDSDEPLFLTPLIQDKNRPRQEIQNLARVDRAQFKDVESFAGYLTVNKHFNSNMFFWYFPAEENSTYAPVVLWLQGGPGVSSLYGLLYEMGPFEIDESGCLIKRNYTWNRDHNLIFIDNPVGTGYSFTENDAGYAKNEIDVGINLHEAMMQLYELFEWKDSIGFWITGESYAGKYIPALAYHIYKAQAANIARIHLPLKGLSIGNGFCDPINQLKYGDYLYQLGLIDEHGLAEFHVAEQKITECIKLNDLGGAFDRYDLLLNGEFTMRNLFYNLTGYKDKYNYLNPEYDDFFNRLQIFMNCSGIRRALHVGNRAFVAYNLDIYARLRLDIMDTIAPWLIELLNHYTICFYNGQLDISVAYPLTRNFLQNLKFAAAEEYKTAKRQIWYIDDEVAGYIKNAGNLIEVMVRNGGHLIPKDQPKWMYNLIYQLTHYKRVQ